MINHYRDIRSIVPSVLILSYLIFLFVAPWCHVHDVDREHIDDDGYHCHSPIAHSSHGDHDSDHHEHHDNDHHWLSSHQCILALNDKFIVYNGFSFDNKSNYPCQPSSLWHDTEAQINASGSCCNLTPGSNTVTNKDRIIILLCTDLPPPVC